MKNRVKSVILKW